MTTLIILASIILFVFLAAYFVQRLPSFGALPEGARLERIRQSPNYRDGEFKNRYNSDAPTLSGSWSDRLRTMWTFFFNRPKDTTPQEPLPFERHDLTKLDKAEDLVLWFGHSGYLLQQGGVRFLIDPVFEEGGPLGLGNAFFPGTQIYHAKDMPEIDYLLLTHDHWDHVDYAVVKGLQPRIKKVFTGLGVGAHLERWGYRPDQIVELDWDESTPLEEGGRLHFLPTQHFSGRGLKSGQSLWGSFLIQQAGKTVYVGGDSGFGPHYAEIGRTFPGIDLAILENGQYSTDWSPIHMLPEYLGQTMRELGAKRYLTVHHGKFALAMHPWKEPLEHAKRLRDVEGFPVLLPRMGQPVRYLDSALVLEDWWEGLK